MTRKADIQKLIVNYNRRLQKLKEQQALSGLNTEPRVLLEIEDIEAEIDQLEAELASLPETPGDAEAFLAAGGDWPRSQGGSRIINTGGGSYIEGGVHTGGGDFVGRDQTKSTGLGAAEIASLFAPIYSHIQSLPGSSPEDKADLKSDVEDVEAEVRKGDNADESLLSRRLRNIQRMAPDILDVLISTLTSPVAGFSTVVRRVVERMSDAR